MSRVRSLNNFDQAKGLILYTGAGGEAPEYLIEQSFTDASVFLTVYPTQLDMADADWNQLGNQIKNCPCDPMLK